MEYKVRLYIDNIYLVVASGYERDYDNAGMFKSDTRYEGAVVFKGTIVECEAFIRLKEKGQI